MEPSRLLAQTIQAFAELQNEGRPKSYPRHLRSLAITLLTDYTIDELSESLNITTRTLQNWLRDRDAEQNSAPPATFIPLNLAEAKPGKISESPVQLRLKLPHNLELILPEQKLSKTANLICALVKEFDQCSI